MVVVAEPTGGRNVTALNVARRAFLARREREGGIHIASKIHPKGSDLVVSAVYDPVRFGFGFQQRGRRAAERRHPTGRERMDSTTLQPLQDPILLLPWACFRGGSVSELCHSHSNRRREPRQGSCLLR